MINFESTITVTKPHIQIKIYNRDNLGGVIVVAVVRYKAGDKCLIHLWRGMPRVWSYDSPGARSEAFIPGSSYHCDL
jgi:hypothetical protein